MQFDRRYQESFNGPLTPQVRRRIYKFREVGFTLREIGDRLGFSGTFIARMIRDKKPANVRTTHIAAMIQMIEHAELENGIILQTNELQAAKITISEMSLEDLVKAIAAKGFDVTISPKSVRM